MKSITSSITLQGFLIPNATTVTGTSITLNKALTDRNLSLFHRGDRSNEEANGLLTGYDLVFSPPVESIGNEGHDNIYNTQNSKQYIVIKEKKDE
jgi:hypothetical protein